MEVAVAICYAQGLYDTTRCIPLGGRISWRNEYWRNSVRRRLQLGFDCDSTACSTAYHTSQGQQGHSDVARQWPLTARPLRPK